MQKAFIGALSAKNQFFTLRQIGFLILPLALLSATRLWALGEGEFTISGLVTEGGVGVENVKVGYSAEDFTLTDNTGAYTLTKVAAGDYTVTPVAFGYIFTPDHRDVTVTNTNVRNIDFTAVDTLAAVSGRITNGANGVPGVSVTDGARITTTDANGNYIIKHVPDATYTITPTLAGVVFTPVDREVTVAGASITGQDFTAQYAVTGTITSVSSSPIRGVLVNAGAVSGLTNSQGVFTIPLDPGNYTITPSLGGYTFAPASRSIVMANAPVTGQDFTGTPVGSISGTIKSSATPVPGIEVAAGSFTATTDNNGVYTMTGMTPGQYIITPSAIKTTFTPATRSVTVGATPVLAQDFAAAFAVSGAITSNGSPLGGVSVTDGINTVTTNGFGEFALPCESGVHTITPTLVGYVFTPPSRQVTVAIAPIYSTDFTAQPPPNTVSGRVTAGSTPVPGVVVSDGANNSGTTDASGNYTVEGVPGGKFVLTPAMPGASFTPATRSGTQFGEPLTGFDFSAKFSVSGTVIDSLTSLPVQGVTVSSAVGTSTSNAQGQYSIMGFTPGTYLLTPTATGYTFSPATIQVIVNNAPVIKDIVATPLTNSISGLITVNSIPLPNVAVSAGARVGITNGSGVYTITNVATGTYQVIPALNGYTFLPASRTVKLQGSDVAGQDFTALLNISGFVRDEVLNGIAGVTVSSGAKVTTTDENGRYVLTGFPPGTYTVTPNKPGYAFAPSNRQITLNAAPGTADFTGTAVQYSISGRVTLGANGLSGVLITDGLHQAVTDATGNYTLENLTAGSYTVSPSKSGYAFTPSSLTVTIITNNVVGKNFTAQLNLPPVIPSGIIYSPNPGNVNKPVTFTCVASDAQKLTWSWTFGDGGTGVSASASIVHTYAVAGNYLVKVVVTDLSGLSASASATARIVNADLDTDGDSYPDQLERETLGTNPNNNQSKPGGTADFDSDSAKDDLDDDDDNDLIADLAENTQGTNPYDGNSATTLPMASSKVSGALKPGGGKDTYSVTATIEGVGAINQIAGQTIKCSLGGAVVQFTLDGKGKGKSSFGTVALKTTPKLGKDGSFGGGKIVATIKVKNGNFAAAWLDEGVNLAETTKKTIQMRTSISLNNSVYSKSSDCSLASKAGKSAAFKSSN